MIHNSEEFNYALENCDIFDEGKHDLSIEVFFAVSEDNSCKLK